MDLDDGSENEKKSKLMNTLREFQTYIENNASFIPNYGERWRYGETIESGVCRIDREPSDRQADGQEPADAMEPTRCSSAASGSHKGPG